MRGKLKGYLLEAFPVEINSIFHRWPWSAVSKRLETRGGLQVQVERGGLCEHVTADVKVLQTGQVARRKGEKLGEIGTLQLKRDTLPTLCMLSKSVDKERNELLCGRMIGAIIGKGK
jgi:hypothetical protein